MVAVAFAGRAVWASEIFRDRAGLGSEAWFRPLAALFLSLQAGLSTGNGPKHLKSAVFL